MIALDTNVLVRYLVRDDEPQTALATTLIETECSTEELGLVTFPEFLRKTGIAAYWDEFGAPEDCPDFPCTNQSAVKFRRLPSQFR